MVGGSTDDKQMLTVSSPCTLLNHIAQRYTRTSRIIMEYVDNSLDDAEALYKESKKSYSRKIQILVEINRKKAEQQPVQQNDVSEREVLNGTKSILGAVKAKKKSGKTQEKWITEVTVTDNCRGMDQASLNRLIVNVGDSSKRGSKFTNGHFGFGVHAFRACAKNLEFKTKTYKGETLGLKIDRDTEYFSKPKYVCGEGILTRSGTVVKVSNFDNTWSEQLDSREIIKEIQHHFSGLLERKNLQINVKNTADGTITECWPFQFNFTVNKKIKKAFKFDENVVRVQLYVAQSPQIGRKCMFVSKGRRVNEIADVKSFMKMSRCRWAVWGHPNLLGYIDVTNVLEPVITRDEFRLNSTRKNLYNKIIDEIEPALYKALHEINENRKVQALAKLEDVVSKCVNVAVKKDLRRHNDGLSYLQQMMLSKKSVHRKKIDEDFDVENPKLQTKKRKLEENRGGDEKPVNGENDEKKNKKRRSGLGFNIAFVKELYNEKNGEPCRARLIGEDMQVNMRHPDFLARIKINKSDHQPIVTERLCGYLANVIAAAYKSYSMLRGGGMERYENNHALLLDEILDVTLSLENQLRSKLKLMQREMETGVQAAAAAAARKHSQE